MGRGRDEAGNIWELDAQGAPVRMIQPATRVATPGALAVVPPNPAMVAKNLREQQRQDAADARAERSDQRAAATAAREQAKFEKEDMVAPPPGDVTKTGEEYLATIPHSLAGQVKALSDGRRAFPTGSALRSPAIQQLVAAATQYDPTLDAANAATRVATRKKFTSGTTRDNITAINTALGHLGTLYKDGQKLENRGVPVWNMAANALETASGDPRVTNFNLTRHAVVDELEKAFRGSGGTQAGIDEWKQGINSSQSPDQWKGAISKGVELLQSRLQALTDAYASGMGKSADPMILLNPHAQAVFNALGPGGDGNVPDTPRDFGGLPPLLRDDGGNPPPDKPPPAPTLGGTPPPPGAPVGWHDQSKTEYDPLTSARLNALIHKGRPIEEGAAILPPGSTALDPRSWQAAIAYAKDHPGWVAAESTKITPTGYWERQAASPAGAYFSGASSALTGGFNDEIAGGVEALGGGDYTQGRDAFNANKNIEAELHPAANSLGNVAGGVGATMLGAGALARFAPGLGARVAGALAPSVRAGQTAGTVADLGAARAAILGDAAYGGAYGAGESNQDRGMGALTGAIAGAGGGMVGRGTVGGFANIIAPPAGRFAPAYAQGVFPTIGQRFGQSGFAGRAINTAEQAMQSFPGLGTLVSRARQIPRDQFQVGGFNEALGEIGQKLPDSMGPGTEPHSFTAKAFRDAYDKARQGMQFVPDPEFALDTRTWLARLHDGTLSPAQAHQVQQRVGTAVEGRLAQSGNILGGDAYQRVGTELGDTIADWSKDGTTAPMARALGEYVSIFDNAARRNSVPQAVAMLDQADRGYAKLVRIQDAARRAGGDAGTFSPKAFERGVQNSAGGVRSGPFLRGDALMQDYADAGKGLVDTLPNSGSADRLLLGQGMAGTAGVGVGAPAAIMAHPGSLAPFALYMPGINKAVTRAIAPRSATLPPNIAAVLEGISAKLNDRRGAFGRLAVPGALALEFNQ